jgi:Family of unknown function (DUF6510)
MEALDGNAIAGLLYEHYEREMTTAVGACTHCHTSACIAELDVYVKAPGAVARCRHCGDVVFVLVSVRGVTNIHAEGFSLDDN